MGGESTWRGSDLTVNLQMIADLQLLEVYRMTISVRLTFVRESSAHSLLATHAHSQLREKIPVVPARPSTLFAHWCPQCTVDPARLHMLGSLNPSCHRPNKEYLFAKSSMLSPRRTGAHRCSWVLEPKFLDVHSVLRPSHRWDVLRGCKLQRTALYFHIAGADLQANQPGCGKVVRCSCRR